MDYDQLANYAHELDAILQELRTARTCYAHDHPQAGAITLDKCIEQTLKLRERISADMSKIAPVKMRGLPF